MGVIDASVRCNVKQQLMPPTPPARPACSALLQAELNTNLHEQVILLRGQKELAEAKGAKSAAEVKKLAAKVGCCCWLAGGGYCWYCCR